MRPSPSVAAIRWSGVVVYQRAEESDAPVEWQKGRDLWWHELVKGKPDYCEPTWVGGR
jgi:acetyl-CoA synthetase